MLEMQDLCAIDSNRSRYYTMGVDVHNKNVSLRVFSFAADYTMKIVPLPEIMPSQTPGLGEGVTVNPTDGTIILMGHDAARAGHHSIFTLDPTTFALTFVADLGGDLTNDLLGAAFTYDHDADDLYVSLAYNNSGLPASKLLAVSLKDGTVQIIPRSLRMDGMAYDSQTRRIYGTHVGPHGNVKNLMLAYFNTAKRDALSFVASFPMYVGIGNIHTFDRTNRVLYTLLSANPPKGDPYVHTDFCADHKEPCPSGSSCCCEPPCTDKERCAPSAPHGHAAVQPRSKCVFAHFHHESR